MVIALAIMAQTDKQYHTSIQGMQLLSWRNVLLLLKVKELLLKECHVWNTTDGIGTGVCLNSLGDSISVLLSLGPLFILVNKK